VGRQRWFDDGRRVNWRQVDHGGRWMRSSPWGGAIQCNQTSLVPPVERLVVVCGWLAGPRPRASGPGVIPSAPKAAATSRHLAGLSTDAGLALAVKTVTTMAAPVLLARLAFDRLLSRRSWDRGRFGEAYVVTTEWPRYYLFSGVAAAQTFRSSPGQSVTEFSTGFPSSLIIAPSRSARSSENAVRIPGPQALQPTSVTRADRADRP
jgi:hypothetical protein